MHFNEHFNLVGKHALLGASKHYWINYSEEKLIQYYYNMLAVQEGTEDHDLAARLIRKGWKLQGSKKTINSYVNDAIGYKMTPEQVLYFSDNCFGTADAISFKRNFLRIHDLKTGSSPTSMSQLMIYAALFCLEYNIKPETIGMELRIYQNDEIKVYIPKPEEIKNIMDKIVKFDECIEKAKGKDYYG